MKLIFYFLIFVLMQSQLFSTTVPNQKLIIIRHGQAENNIERIYNSNPDSPNYQPKNLTAKGVQDVEQTEKKLRALGFNHANIVAIYVSPLPRTKQTANILVQLGFIPRGKIIEDKRLIEVQAGDSESKALLGEWQDSFATKYHMETPQHVRERVQDFYNSIKDKYPTGNVMVITHGQLARELVDIVTNQWLNFEPGEAKVVPLH